MFWASLHPSSGGQTAFHTWLASNLHHTVHTACIPTLQHHIGYYRTENHRQWNTVWPPDDGCKDARNMLRNSWLTIKWLIVASSWSRLYLLVLIVFEHGEVCVCICAVLSRSILNNTGHFAVTCWSSLTHHLYGISIFLYMSVSAVVFPLTSSKNLLFFFFFGGYLISCYQFLTL